MRFSSSLYFAATYACSFLLPLVVSELKMTVMLNNGVLPTKEGYTCTPNDSKLINNAIVDKGRRLQTKTKAQCKDECAGVVSGSCHVTGCKGFRRQLESKNLRTNHMAGNRKLNDADDAVCSYGMEQLNKKLDALLPTLSASCQPVVKSMRNVTCFDDVRYAKVEGFNLWNADNDTIVATNFKDSASFCYTNSKLNIEAIANACVERMEMNLVGPVEEKEDSRDTAPYTIFGFDDNNRNNLFGRRLPVGKYTVTTELEDSFTPKSKIKFTIKKC